MNARTHGWLLALGAALIAPKALAQTTFAVEWPTGERDPSAALVSLDHDDDNDDGVPDLAETSAPDVRADDEIVPVRLTGVTTGAVRVTVSGGLRVALPTGMVTTWNAPVTNGSAVVPIVGIAASRSVGDSSLTFTAGAIERRVAVTIAATTFLHGDNSPVYAHRDAVGISREVTTNDTLPRTEAWGDRSPDPDNLRVEVWDAGASSEGSVRVESVGSRASFGVAPGVTRTQLARVGLSRVGDGSPWRTRFLRLVGDDLDLRAPGVQGRTLLVGLRDRVRARYRREGIAGEVTGDVAVGRPGNEDGPLAARAARWHILVLRDRPASQGGTVMVGNDDAGAMRIARRQVEISNEVYLQCAITWGDPDRANVSIVDPPPRALLAIGDNDGLVAAGGVVRLRANSTVVGPVRQAAGWAPMDTARAVAAALRDAGFNVRVTENPRTDYGAHGSVDLIVRDGGGRLATLSPAAGAPLSTDARQRVSLGAVDFTDGIDEFNNLNSSSGTLEERSMVKLLMDDDAGTIDLFMVNRFARSTRIGEAFVEGDGGSIVNGLLLDRTGISAEREAWTQSHEAGHILLDQPWHPDNMGPDRPWLLMDSDASLGAVTGPKRLTREECDRIHQQSGVGAVPALLTRFDVVRVSPRAGEFRAWPAAALYPVPARTETRAGDGPSVREGAPHEPDRRAAEYGIDVRL